MVIEILPPPELRVEPAAMTRVGIGRVSTQRIGGEWSRELPLLADRLARSDGSIATRAEGRLSGADVLVDIEIVPWQRVGRVIVRAPVVVMPDVEWAPPMVVANRVDVSARHYWCS